MISADMGGVPRASVIGRWVRAVASKFKRPAQLKNTNRAEFEQIARDLDLSPPQLYRLLTGQALSAGAVEKRLSDMEIDSEPAEVSPREAASDRRNAGTSDVRAVLLLNASVGPVRPVGSLSPDWRKTGGI